MKKTVLGFLFGLFAATVFAGPFSDLGNSLSAFDDGTPEAVPGTIKEGQDILPILWKYVYDEPTLDNKVLGFVPKFTDYDVINNTYEIEQAVYYKFGIGLQCQKSTFKVVQDGTNVSVQTLKMSTFSVDSKLNRKTDPIENPTKSKNINSKNILGDILKISKDFSDSDYQAWSNKAFYDFDVQISVSTKSNNKLKAKRWYDKHPLEGKTITSSALFGNLNESKKNGYEFKIVALYPFDKDNIVYVEIYTNDDKCMDYKNDQEIKFSGKVTEVKFSDREYETKYKIEYVSIEE